MRLGKDWAQEVDPDLNERALALEEVREALNSLIQSLDGLDGWEDELSTAESWFSEAESELANVQDVLEEQLKGHDAWL